MRLRLIKDCAVGGELVYRGAEIEVAEPRALRLINCGFAVRAKDPVPDPSPDPVIEAAVVVPTEEATAPRQQRFRRLRRGQSE